MEAGQQFFFPDEDLYPVQILSHSFEPDERMRLEVKLHYGGYSVVQQLVPGAILFGFGPSDLQPLGTHAGQRHLVQVLADTLLPAQTASILSLCCPCGIMVAAPDGNGEFSHLLGAPKFPPGSAAPTEAGQSLFHVATLRCAELDQLEALNSMSGYLSFYVHPETFEARVLYYNEPPASAPEAPAEPQTAFNYFPMLDLPSDRDMLIEILEMTREEREQYGILRSFYQKILLNALDTHEYNKLLGYPDPIQSCVALDAACVAARTNDYAGMRYAATEWQLLLQLSTEAGHPFAFLGAMGSPCLYFLIRREDFAQRRFDRIQVIMQGT